MAKHGLNFVRKCKRKFPDNETYKKLHLADNNETLCGKELNEMWFVESSWGLSFDDVTCEKCLKKALEEGPLK